MRAAGHSHACFHVTLVLYREIAHSQRVWRTIRWAVSGRGKRRGSREHKLVVTGSDHHSSDVRPWILKTLKRPSL